MNNNNLTFLQDNLKYLGFGEKTLLNEELEQEFLKDTKEFQLYTEAFYDNDYKVEATLYFRKPDDYEMYFFNKYEACLRNGDEADIERKQTFYISKGSGITFKEAFNLLQGRAVNKDLIGKEGIKYNAWLQLNFEEMTPSHNYKMKQFGPNFGYDLEKVLERYPIRELKTEQTKVLLLQALRRGNLQPVHFLKSDRSEKMFIEATPQYKSISIYTSTIMAAQKSIKKPAHGVKAEAGEKPDSPESGEWEKAAFTDTVEEGYEELVESPPNKPPAKKGSRK